MNKEVPKGYYTAKEIAHYLGIERQQVYDFAKYMKVHKFHNGIKSRAEARTFYPIDQIRKISELHQRGFTYKQIAQAELNNK